MGFWIELLNQSFAHTPSFPNSLSRPDRYRDGKG